MKLLRTFIIILSVFAVQILYGQSGWIQQPSNTTNDLYGFFGSSPLPPNVKFAVGANGTIIYSSDAGLTWNSLPDTITNDLYGVSFQHADTAYAFGQGGVLLKIRRLITGEYAIDILSPGVPTSISIRDVYAAPNPGRLVIIVGDSGTILQSPNRGATWESTSIPVPTTRNLRAISYHGQNDIYVVGDSGTILKGRVSRQWSAQVPPYIFSATNFYGIGLFQINGRGIVVGDHGAIATTTNGGTIWQAQNSNVSVKLRNVFIPVYGLPGFTPGTAWAVGDSGTILKSMDYGDTWTQQPSGTTKDLYKIAFTDSTNGLIVGESGTILKTTTGGIFKPIYSATPATLIFGQVPIGFSKTVAFTINNNGVSPMIISSMTLSNSDFTITPTVGTILPFSSQPFEVTFTPTQVGIPSSSITINSNAEGNPHIVNAYGFGIHEPLRTGWQWQHPVPHGNLLNDIQFFNSAFGIAVGDLGTIMKTTDGGTNWSVQSYPGGNRHRLQGVTFIDQKNITVVGEYGTILRSFDSGDHWVDQPSGAENFLSAVSFSDLNNGFAAGSSYQGPGVYGSIHRTTDGGATWVQQFSSNTVYILGIKALTPTVAIAVGVSESAPKFDGIILRTSDAGSHWVEVKRISQYYFRSVDFASQTTGIAVGNEIFRTTDGGVSWVQVQAPVADDFINVRFTSVTNGYIFGAWGSTLQTTDAGLSWIASQISAANYLYAGAYSDASNGFASLITFVSNAYRARFLRTTDGGTSWNDLPGNLTYQNLHSVSFSDLLYGTAVGDSGTVLRTSDGGSSWSRQLQGTLFSAAGIPFNGVAFPEMNVGTIVGGGGNIIRTTDGGLHWASQTSGVTSTLNGVSFSDPSNGIAVGNAGTLIRTTDGGEHWMNLSGSVPGNLRAVSFGDVNRVAVVGDGGALLHSTNDGATWLLASNLPQTDLYGVALHGDTITAVGPNGIIIHSPDGGFSWNTLPSGSPQALRAISYAGMSGTIVGDAGTIARSSDGGMSWSLQNSGTVGNLSGVVNQDATMATVVGSGGTILHTTTGGVFVTDVKPEKQLPKEFSLSQNYPNPFNPTTTIRFGVSGLRFVSLKVYDVLGKEVATLVNEIKQPGTYEVTWDGSRLASGVYFYQLHAGDFVSVKKMLMIK